MNDDCLAVRTSLRQVDSTTVFKRWVRCELRTFLPHASLLVTTGKLYRSGSIPTHRIDVDFPLCMVEELKNSAGALDDPSIFNWLRSERPRLIDIASSGAPRRPSRWQETLASFGVQELLIHGVLDHKSRRFVIFQMINPRPLSGSDSIKILSSFVEDMSRAIWAAIDRRVREPGSQLVGHPTLSLTAAEVHIIELLAQGLSNKEIARRRGVSDSTVKTQVQRTGSKIGATRRSEIVAIGMPLLNPLPAQTMIDYDDDRR